MRGISDFVIDRSVVKHEDGYARIYWHDTPLGGKLQVRGPRCRWRHEWAIDEYPGVRGVYRDKICRKCTRRKPLN